MAAVATTATATSTQQVKKPDHVFTVSGARDAANAADRVVQDWTADAFTGKITAAKETGNDPGKIDVIIAFYRQAPAAITQLNAAIANCCQNDGWISWLTASAAAFLLGNENEALTRGRKLQFDLLQLTDPIRAWETAAKADAAALHTKMDLVQKAQNGVAFPFSQLTMELGSACKNYLVARGSNPLLGGEPAIQAYETSKAAAPSVPIAPAKNDEKAPEKPAVSSTPNPNHLFYIKTAQDMAPSYKDIANIDWKKDPINEENCRNAVQFLKCLESMEKAEKDCSSALIPDSDRNTKALRVRGFFDQFVIAKGKAQKDQAELRLRIASILQKAGVQKIEDFRPIVEGMCKTILNPGMLAHLIPTSLAGSWIDQFEQRYPSKPNAKTAVVPTPVVTPVAPSQPQLSATPAQPSTVTTSTTVTSSQPTAPAKPVAQKPTLVVTATTIAIKSEPPKTQPFNSREFNNLAVHQKALTEAIEDFNHSRNTKTGKNYAQIHTDAHTYLSAHKPAEIYKLGSNHNFTKAWNSASQDYLLLGNHLCPTTNN